MAKFTIATSAKHPKGVTILLYQQALVRGHLWQSWEVTADLAGGIGVQGSQAAAQPADPQLIVYVADCAADMEVAESTIRTHVKSVFAKTGRTRQSQLGSLLQTRPGIPAGEE